MSSSRLHFSVALGTATANIAFVFLRLYMTCLLIIPWMSRSNSQYQAILADSQVIFNEERGVLELLGDRYNYISFV